MSGELDGLENWITDTIESMGASERRRLLTTIGRDLRRNTSRRMLSQVGPDGRKWAARKDGTRKKMFKRLRLAKNLKSKATADQVKIGYSGRAGAIARIHHYGLRDGVTKRGVRVKYEARELLGLSELDIDQVSSTVTQWIKGE